MLRIDASPEWEGRLSFDAASGRIDYIGKPTIYLSSDTELWIVRHAETFANQKKILQGSDQENEDTVLSPTGEAQAMQAAEQMIQNLMHSESQYSRVSVLSSPARRAGQTAQYFLNQFRHVSPLRCDYSEHAFLHEIRFGEISGLTEEEVFQLGPDYVQFAELFRKKGDALVRLNGGESFHDLLLRVKEGVLDWQASSVHELSGSKRAVIIFTHMITASALRVLLQDESLLEMCPQSGDSFVNWRRIIKNAECLVWDDVSHRTHMLKRLEGKK